MGQKEFTYKVANDGSGDVALAADVYWNSEKSAQPKAIAIYHHGGSFTVGSKAMLGKPHIEKLLDLEFVVVSYNYRLCPTISIREGPVADAIDLYKWAQTKLPDLLKQEAGVAVNGNEIVTLGHSCGGTLALLLAGQPKPPLAILDLFGMKYLEDPFYHEPQNALSALPSVEDDFLQKVFEDVPPPTGSPPPFGPKGPDLSTPRNAWLLTGMKKGTLLDKILPQEDVDVVEPTKLFSKGNFPPTYFIHGTVDTVVDVKFARRAHEELKAKGSETELVIVEGAPHGFDARVSAGDKQFEIIAAGLEFLQAQVAKSRA